MLGALLILLSVILMIFKVAGVLVISWWLVATPVLFLIGLVVLLAVGFGSRPRMLTRR